MIARDVEAGNVDMKAVNRREYSTSTGGCEQEYSTSTGSCEQATVQHVYNSGPAESSSDPLIKFTSTQTEHFKSTNGHNK